MRVAVVGACPYPVPQGSQVYMRECARAAALAGAEVHLVVYGYGNGEPGDPFPVHRGANPLGSSRTDAGPFFDKAILDAVLVRKLRQVVRDYNIDVIDAHNYEGLCVALAARCRPIVYHPHNAMADELPHYTRAKRAPRAFGRYLDRGLPKRADRIVAPHRRLADYLVSCGCALERISVQPPPLSATPPMARTFRNPPAVVYTGNLDAYQNLDILRTVAARLREQRPDIDLIVATASNRPLHWARTVHVPTLEALNAVLREDVIVVCPRVSWSGYPIKLLNAMNAGVPIVCAQSAAHGLENGVTGMVIADDDPDAMLMALTTLIDDQNLRQRLGTAARVALESTHNPKNTGLQLLEIYQSLLQS